MERIKRCEDWVDKSITVINYAGGNLLTALRFWGGTWICSSLSTSCLSFSCWDSSFSPPPSPPLCFIYSLWFTWDLWSSPLIVVITPILPLQCIMHNRITMHRRGGKAILLFIGLLMHAGRHLSDISSRTGDDGWLRLSVFNTGSLMIDIDKMETMMIWGAILLFAAH